MILNRSFCNGENLHAMNLYFKQIKCFEQIKKRLEQQQQQIDLLREETNLRFKQVETHSEQQQQQIDLLREEMNLHFEQIERRRTQIDWLCEEINLCFEQVEEHLDQRQQQIDLLREKMNRRLEKIETRLDQQQQQIDLLRKDVLDLERQIAQIISDIEQMNIEIIQFDGWLKLISGMKGDEKGQALEQTFALGLSYGLKDRDIKPETIQLRQLFVDSEGVVFFKKGKLIEVDLIAENHKLTVFEVKSSPEEADVEHFAKKIKVVQLAHPEKQVQGIFISPGASEAVEQHCQEWGIQFLG